MNAKVANAAETVQCFDCDVVLREDQNYLVNKRQIVVENVPSEPGSKRYRCGMDNSDCRILHEYISRMQILRLLEEIKEKL